MDSTIFCREGKQEGACKGYNPKRKGRPSHHPLVAVLAEVPFVLHGWLRSGKCSSARGVVAFLTEALALAPAAWKIVGVRADSGFFADELLTFLELKQLPYIAVARLPGAVKRSCMGLQEWTALGENYAVGEIWLQLHGWQTQRRFVVLRERVREGKPCACPTFRAQQM